jgi:multimeric flavodoxin WrbA
MASPKPTVRKLDVYQPLDKAEFRRRFFERFADPAFDAVSAELDEVFEVAWDGFIHYRKSPRKRRAGPGFANPDYELSLDWIQARERIQEAERRFADAGAATRILLVNGSTRSEHTCPGEASKTRRLLLAAKQVIEGSPGSEVDVLDLSELAYEPLKVIHPCKACVSTAMPLCHWPCSCYPNHAMGQTNDWMNEIYPRWVAAHGVMVLCPVHWYQTPASLKLMIDRLVCADGGNPDPTTTGGKDAELAKQVELSGWDYPRHLAGRAFAVVTHADAAGAGEVRRALADWLSDIGLVQAGSQGVLDRFIGYYRPYATSHDELDGDPAIFDEVRNAAQSLVEMAMLLRSGQYRAPDEDLEEPRKK